MPRERGAHDFYHFEDNAVVRALCVLLWSQAMKVGRVSNQRRRRRHPHPLIASSWWLDSSIGLEKPSPIGVASQAKRNLSADVRVMMKRGLGKEIRLDSTSVIDGDALAILRRASNHVVQCPLGRCRGALEFGLVRFRSSSTSRSVYFI